MIKSRYYNESELQRIVDETEAALDQQAHERRLEAQIAWLNDIANAHIVNNDPMVRAIRATDPQRNQPNVPSTTPRIGAPRTAPSGLPPGYKDRATLEREKPWLAPRKTELQSIIDPMAGRKPNRI
jgi:hypothetical protein